jgi:hypothetical protein
MTAGPASFPSTYEKIWRRLRFVAQFRAFRKLAAGSSRFDLAWRDRFPFMYDDRRETPFDRHYILHCAWAARVLAATRPALHVDIGSSLTFSTQVSAFVPIDFYDLRPARLALTGLRSKSADLMALPFADGSLPSLSCMHTIEHIGLGRYGDPLDPDGDLKALAELTRVLAPNGDLLVVVPVGRPRIAYNAHRIYSHEMVLAALARLRLHEFTLIPDDPADGDLIVGASPTLVARQAYGCGCFWFKGP